MSPRPPVSPDCVRFSDVVPPAGASGEPSVDSAILKASIELSGDEFPPGAKVTVRYACHGCNGDMRIYIVPAAFRRGPPEQIRGRKIRSLRIDGRLASGETQLLLPSRMGRYELRMEESSAAPRLLASVTLLVVDRRVPGYQWEVIPPSEFDPQLFLNELAAEIKKLPGVNLEAAYESLVPPVSVASGSTAASPGEDSEATEPAREYVRETWQEVLRDLRRVELAFPHEIDVAGRLEKLARAIVGFLALEDRWFPIRDAVFGAGDFLAGLETEALLTGHIPVQDFQVFVVKTALDQLETARLQQVAKRLRLSEALLSGAVARAISETEADFHFLGQPGGGAYMRVLQTVVPGAFDASCTACAISRRALVDVNEVMKAVRAFANDRATRAAFLHWRNEGDLPCSAGDSQVRDKARAVLESLNRAKGLHREISPEQIDKYIRSRFELWGKLLEEPHNQGGLPAAAGEIYLVLDDDDQRLFGAGERQPVEGFAALFVIIRNDLLRYRGMHDYSETVLNRRASQLALRFSKGIRNEYERAFAFRLRQLGWIVPLAEAEEAMLTRIRERLVRLDREKLDSLMDYLGIEAGRGLFDCLCEGDEKTSATSPVPASPDDERHQLPTDDELWATCIAHHPIAYGPESITLDRFINDLIARSRIR